MKFTAFLALALLSVAIMRVEALSYGNVVITQATKSVDLNTQLVYEDSFITFKNSGGSSLNELYFALEDKYLARVALITVEDPEDGSLYKHEEIPDPEAAAKHNATIFKIHLKNSLAPSKDIRIKVSVTYYQRMEALPKEITVLEEQLMVFEDSSILFSPYKILLQNSEYKLAGPVKSQVGGGIVKENRVEYPEVKDIQPFSRSPLRIHFENNFPFAVFNEVVKSIYISHWGNIHIVEEYKLENQGALITGEFNRIDVNNQQNGKNSLKSLHADLPGDTWGLHYRDEIGNISTSNAFRHEDRVSLTIRPRFPVFGGWKVWWDLSYNLPTNNYLFQDRDDDSRFLLRQTFGFPFPSMIAENFTLKLIFPEGTKNVDIHLPFPIDSQHWEKTYDILDFEGRPTLVIKKKNVVHYHHKEFTVNYQFDSVNTLIEPIYLFVAFVVAFAVLIVYGRLDFEFKRRSTGPKVKHE